MLPSLAALVFSMLTGLASDKTTLQHDDAMIVRLLLIREGMTSEAIERALRLNGRQGLGWRPRTYSLAKDAELDLNYKFDGQDQSVLQWASLRKGENIVLEVPAAKLRPTRDAFLSEVLDAQPTKVTPKFDDYTRGSYHINKLDLLKGLIVERRIRKLDLRAVMIVGPYPPLWTYEVTVFLREGDKVRANALLFPHARITGKATGHIKPEDLERLVNGISQNEIAKSGLPKDKDGKFSEYQLLVATWSSDGKEMTIKFGELLLDEKKFGKFCELYNDVAKQLKRTYPEPDE